MGIEKNIIEVISGLIVISIILAFPLSIMYDHYKWKKNNGRLNPNKYFLENFWGSNI